SISRHRAYLFPSFPLSLFPSFPLSLFPLGILIKDLRIAHIPSGCRSTLFDVDPVRGNYGFRVNKSNASEPRLYWKRTRLPAGQRDETSQQKLATRVHAQEIQARRLRAEIETITDRSPLVRGI